MFTKQNANTAGGHIVGGNLHETHIHGTHSPLAFLYKKLRDADCSQTISGSISEQLQHYCGTPTDGDIRGLEEKLKTAGRTDLVVPAAQLKQAASKLIMKWQTSGVAQDIITHVLAKLYTDFLMHVTPSIQDGLSRASIDALIGEKVLKPAQEMLGDNDLMITASDLLGMLFFLGGNCHIRWDAC